MNIRRTVAALLTAVALTSTGALTACTDPVNANTGTPKDTARNTSGSDPGGVSQGNLPRNDSNEVSSTDNAGRNENSDRDSGG